MFIDENPERGCIRRVRMRHLRLLHGPRTGASSPSPIWVSRLTSLISVSKRSFADMPPMPAPRWSPFSERETFEARPTALLERPGTEIVALQPLRSGTTKAKH